MKLVGKTNTCQQGRRFDGCLVTIEGIPHSPCVWQVNHGCCSARARNWFETKGEAIEFAAKSALPCNEWEEIYIIGYPKSGAMRAMDGSLLGHRMA